MRCECEQNGNILTVLSSEIIEPTKVSLFDEPPKEEKQIEPEIITLNIRWEEND